jgi:hypothetical protein
MEILIVEAIKTLHSGHKNIKYLVTNNEVYGYDDVNGLAEYVAEEWANRDVGGHNNGYFLEWNIVEDEEVKTIALNAEVSNIENKIKYLNLNVEVLKRFATEEGLPITNGSTTSFLLSKGYEELECPKCETLCKPANKKSDGTIVYENHKCIVNGRHGEEFRITKSFSINANGELIK